LASCKQDTGSVYKLSDKASKGNPLKAWRSLVGQIYHGDEHFFDIMSPTLGKILRGRAAICSASFIQPLFCYRDGKLAAACVLAKVDRLPEYLQLAFFEALPDHAAGVKAMLGQAKTIARQQGCQKLLFGLNFHVNYGLGFQADGFDAGNSFVSAHNPAYYIDYLEPLASEVVKLVNYRREISDFDFPENKRLLDRALRDYSVRPLDFSRLSEEAALYTEINNKAFSDHRFYYERRVPEDLELFNDFRAFMREENLLFLYHKAEPVGFMLWYPDFLQLMRPGETIGFATWLRYLLKGRRIDSFKIVEVGVVPQHQGSLGVMALMRDALARCKGRFRWCESGWILDGNNASLGFGERWAGAVHHQYKVFIVDV